MLLEVAPQTVVETLWQTADLFCCLPSSCDEGCLKAAILAIQRLQLDTYNMRLAGRDQAVDVWGLFPHQALLSLAVRLSERTCLHESRQAMVEMGVRSFARRKCRAR